MSRWAGLFGWSGPGGESEQTGLGFGQEPTFDQAFPFGADPAAFRDERDQQYQAIVLSHLGAAELAAGRHRTARDAWRDAVAILTELDHPDADEVRAKLADHGRRPQAGRAYNTWRYMPSEVASPGMQEPTFLILTALAAQPTHGYGVIRAVEQLSQGEVVLRPGTLYGALDRLTEQGLVEIDHEEAVDGRLRRYYRLTESGAAALTTQVQRLRRNADAAATRLRLAFGGAL